MHRIWDVLQTLSASTPSSQPLLLVYASLVPARAECLFLNANCYSTVVEYDAFSHYVFSVTNRFINWSILKFYRCCLLTPDASGSLSWRHRNDLRLGGEDEGVHLKHQLRGSGDRCFFWAWFRKGNECTAEANWKGKEPLGDGIAFRQEVRTRVSPLKKKEKKKVLMPTRKSPERVIVQVAFVWCKNQWVSELLPLATAVNRCSVTDDTDVVLGA